MTRLFVSATRQHDGKTTTSLGLYCAFKQLGFRLRVHFIKPVGQRYLEKNGLQVDEDAMLFKHVFQDDSDISAMSPVAVPRGFTREYIFNRNPDELYRKIDDAIAKIEHNADITIIEGTGHAGVGSVFDASNADVAKHLNAKAIIISGGGIGRCIDEICLNRALFEQAGVPVLGAIINKVLPAKYEKIESAVRQGLENKGIDCLGVIPHDPTLTYPTVQQLIDELELTVLMGEKYTAARATSTIVAAMEPQNTLQFIKNGTLVITPGDRVDNILVSIATHLVEKIGEKKHHVAGILLSGGLIPHTTIMELMRQSHVPVMATAEDTYSISKKVQKLVVKIGINDSDKIETACSLVAKHVTCEKLLSLLE